MQRSSESIAALASALAKAQSELVNPEKTLTAVLRPSRLGEGIRSFRYAPLASGLEIVRKTLGEHEIATLQTTAVDENSGVINLTTTLAHASGEWISSVWPVCLMIEMATPQRMGAALTYARRYALFTLVGIAGEDDLDAPDTVRPAPPLESQRREVPSVPRKPSNGRLGRTEKNGTYVLRAELSASLRETLIAQIAKLDSREAAANWAAKALKPKNSLTATDAKLVEDAFEQQLGGFRPTDTEPNIDALDVASAEAPQTSKAEVNKLGRTPAQGIKSAVAPAQRPKRHRNKAHLLYVAQQPCLVCARKPSDPHHLRFMQPRALGLKPSDEFAVPLCRMHHRQAHHAGDERKWWESASIDPVTVARSLWEQTRGASKDQVPHAPVDRPKEPSASADSAIAATTP
jgi:hypothetical protein